MQERELVQYIHETIRVSSLVPIEGDEDLMFPRLVKKTFYRKGRPIGVMVASVVNGKVRKGWSLFNKADLNKKGFRFNRETAKEIARCRAIEDNSKLVKIAEHGTYKDSDTYSCTKMTQNTTIDTFVELPAKIRNDWNRFEERCKRYFDK